MGLRGEAGGPRGSRPKGHPGEPMGLGIGFVWRVFS